MTGKPFMYGGSLAAWLRESDEFKLMFARINRLALGLLLFVAGMFLGAWLAQ